MRTKRMFIGIAAACMLPPFADVMAEPSQTSAMMLTEPEVALAQERQSSGSPDGSAAMRSSAGSTGDAKTNRPAAEVDDGLQAETYRAPEGPAAGPSRDEAR